MGGMRHATPLYAKVNSGEHTQAALFAKPPFPGAAPPPAKHAKTHKKRRHPRGRRL